MTIEDITYYIEKDMEEGFYGADCDLREMAHIEVLELLKELKAHRNNLTNQSLSDALVHSENERLHDRVNELSKELKAHREAWDGIKEGLLEMSRLHEYVSIKHMLQLIDGIRPKEGDNE